MHVLNKHPLSDFDLQHDKPLTKEETTVSNEEFDESRIQNPFYYKKSVSLQDTTNAVSTMITDLTCGVSPLETKLKSFINGYVFISESIQQYTMSKIKSYLTTKNLLQDEDTIRFINELQIPDLTRDVKCPADNCIFAWKGWLLSSRTDRDRFGETQTD